ncbi:MAG: putative NUDIX family NTP pyrophosphohydrolase [Saprospiraceae bacterium]|jgi:predicted NUDIX family NTP pyrophosphohydrolase
MSVLDCARLIIYRINKKGLEIFLVQGDSENELDWQIPQGNLKSRHATNLTADDRMILLDPIALGDELLNAMAIECDWHEIPSVRAMIRQDVRIVKDQIKQRIPELEQGAFFAVKEAFKKVLPHEYAMLKELKEVVSDRNQAKYI